jgi:hypothetical protein
VARFGRAAQTCRERGGEQGSVIVEAAIILPILILLIFGAIEFGIAFRDSAQVSASTRAGARIGSTLTDAPDACAPGDSGCVAFLDSIKDAVSDSLSDLTSAKPETLWIYRAGSKGNPVDGPNSCVTHCSTYTWNDASQTWVAQASGNPWLRSARVADACVNKLPAVAIRVTARQEAFTGLFGNRTLTHKTAMRLEPVDPAVCP